MMYRYEDIAEQFLEMNASQLTGIMEAETRAKAELARCQNQARALRSVLVQKYGAERVDAALNAARSDRFISCDIG